MSTRMMSRARWRIWSVCRRRWQGAGILSRRMRDARSCWRRGWKRFEGFGSPSVERRILRRIMKTAIGVMVCGVVVCVGAGAQSLLVADQGEATLSVMDAASGKQVVVEEKTPGVHGHEVVASADGKTAFLPIYGSTGVGKPGIDGHEMLVIDVPSHAVVGRVDFGHGVRPHLPVLDAKRHLLYVTTELDDAVTVIDTRTQKIVGKVPTGAEQSHMLVLSKDGTRGYVSNVGQGTVSALDMEGRKTIAVIPVASDVQRIAISNDDR